MELREGYKKTEVGVIPVDWEVKKLEEISTLIGDGIHLTPQYIDSSDFYFINGNNLVDSKTKSQITLFHRKTGIKFNLFNRFFCY